MKDKRDSFIAYLENVRDRDDRGALAALRRGLGQAPGRAIEMYRYVVPWLPGELTRQQEMAYYLVAALFAYHPMPQGVGTLGTAFRRALREGEDSTAVERRFAGLLAAHPDDLPFYLRQAISFLRAREVPVNWKQLLNDLMAWSHPEGYVQKQWARAFWGYVPENPVGANSNPAPQEEFD